MGYVDLDAPLVGAIDLGAGAPGGNEPTAEAAAAPAAEPATKTENVSLDAAPKDEEQKAAEAKAEADKLAAAKVAEEKAAADLKAAEDAKAKAEEKALADSDRVIELSRSKRDAERRAKHQEQIAASHAANVKKLEPVVELFKLAETDPLAFVAEVADVAGLSPERVLQALQTKGAGGDIAPLTSEEKLALLERKIEELRQPKPQEPKSDRDPEADARAEQAKQGFIETFETILDGAPGAYPNAAKDPDAPQAAFYVLANHWTSHGRQADGSTRPGYQAPTYAQALGAVERALSKKAAPAATSTPPAAPRTPPAPAGGAPPQAKPSGGISNDMGAVLLDSTDRVRSDAEIKADLIRAFGGE